jgi:hypothetical protein
VLLATDTLMVKRIVESRNDERIYYAKHALPDFPPSREVCLITNVCDVGVSQELGHIKFDLAVAQKGYTVELLSACYGRTQM